jgi:hypothetical protein
VPQVLVGNGPLRLSSFLAYCDANADEMPLYLFDKHFALKAPFLAEQYTPPACCGEDLFALLGEEERPDYRWVGAHQGQAGGWRGGWVDLWCRRHDSR